MTVPLLCYYEMKNGQQISTVTARLVYLPVICLLLDRSGQCAVWRQCALADDISF